MRGAQIAVKRAYEPAAAGDGHRVLVDRMWPRGIKKEALHVDVGARKSLSGRGMPAQGVGPVNDLCTGSAVGTGAGWAGTAAVAAACHSGL